MKKLLLALAVTGLVAAPALAQQSTAPGQKMQEQGSGKATTGSSGYAPGKDMHKYSHTRSTKGASRYAPGHEKKTVGMSREKSTIGMSRADRDDLKTRSQSSTTKPTTGTKATTGVSKY